MKSGKISARNESSRTDFLLLLALFVSFRLLTLFLLKPGGFIRDWSDFDTYLGIAQLSDFGLYPYLHFWLEWPPIVPWLMVGAYRLSLLIPVWGEDPRLWFVTILGTVFVLFEAGNFWLIFRLARRLLTDRADVLRVLAMYALLFPPVYAMLGFFDGVALFFILLSLDLLLANRFKWAGVAAAAGALVKLTPIVTAGVAAWLIWHRLKPNWRQVVRGWLGYGAALLGSLAVLLSPFLLTAPQWLVTHGRAVLGRSSWETVWAVLEGYFGYGQLMGDRLNPAETAFAVHPASLPWLWISLAFAAIYLLAFFARPKDLSPRRVLAFGGLTIVLFLLYSKGYSPQFLVLVLPFIILLMPNWAGVGYALALTALNVLEQPVYFVMLPDAHWLLSAVVGLRFAVFVALAVEFWGRVSGFRFRSVVSGQPMINQFHASRFTYHVLRISNLRAVFLTVVFLWMAALLPRAAGEYWNFQASRNSFVEGRFLAAAAGDDNPALVIAAPHFYQKEYAFLHDKYRMKIVDSNNFPIMGVPNPPTVDDAIRGEPYAWVLAQKQELVVRNLGDMGKVVTKYQRFDSDYYELQLVDFAGAGIAPPLLAAADNGIELAAATVKKEKSALTVQLFWHATGQLATLASMAVPHDFTVFTQLLAADGSYIAGHDSPPNNGYAPTGSWQENDLIFDPHTIKLPADLPPGDYRLVAGMYDASGTRLPFFAPDGSPLPDAAIPVRMVHLP